MDKISLENITKNPQNPRNITPEKLGQLAKSIKEFEKMMSLRPIVVDENNVILGGNMRYEALQKLKYTDIPATWVKKAADLSEEEKQRFIFADNLPFGEWDMDVLANNFEIDNLADWGFDVTGINMDGFEPGKEEDQGKFGEFDPVMVTCPECGKEFNAREQK